jgi:acyl-CoA thioester hydrolase
MSRPLPAIRSLFRCFSAVTLRWNDVDVQGHVNNSVPFQLFDTVVSHWQITNGLFHAHDQPICVVVRQSCDFFAEISMMDKVTIGLALEKVGSSSIAYRLGLFVNDTESAAVQGEFVHVVVDQQTRKPTPIPDFARRTLLTLQPQSESATTA